MRGIKVSLLSEVLLQNLFGFFLLFCFVIFSKEACWVLLQLQLELMYCHSTAERDRCVVLADDMGQYAEGRAVCGWMGRQRDDHRV